MQKLLNNAILVLCPSTNIRVVNQWRKRMDGACDKYGRGRVCVQDLQYEDVRGRHNLKDLDVEWRKFIFCRIHADVVCLVKKD
jgi:hypothetical protein